MLSENQIQNELHEQQLCDQQKFEDIETSHMPCVDDRFLLLLADNCKKLRNINFNGCKFVSDKGLAALAR